MINIPSHTCIIANNLKYRNKEEKRFLKEKLFTRTYVTRQFLCNDCQKKKKNKIKKNGTALFPVTVTIREKMTFDSFSFTRIVIFPSLNNHF